MAGLTEAPTSKSIAKKITKAQAVVARAILNNEDTALREVLKLLRELQDNIRAGLSDINTGEFNARHLDRINTLVDAAIADFERRAVGVMNGATLDAANLGASYWSDLSSLLGQVRPGLMPVLPVLSDQMMAVIQAMPTELIRGLSNEVRKTVKSTLQRALLGTRTPFQAMKDIAPLIGSRGGVGAGYAAERIIRTEIGRAFGAADELITQKIADARPEDLPPLKKIWVATIPPTKFSREEHLMAHKQVADVDEAFVVDGEELQYPKDPNGSPGNTINCRCRKIVVPEDMLQDQLADLPDAP